jgi:hypothetical protein
MQVFEVLYFVDTEKYATMPTAILQDLLVAVDAVVLAEKLGANHRAFSLVMGFKTLWII